MLKIIYEILCYPKKEKIGYMNAKGSSLIASRGQSLSVQSSLLQSFLQYKVLIRKTKKQKNILKKDHLTCALLLAQEILLLYQYEQGSSAIPGYCTGAIHLNSS